MAQGLSRLVLIIVALVQLDTTTGMCNVQYLAQPPSQLQCDPFPANLKDPVQIQLQCLATGNKPFEIIWYHNNTNGNIKRLGRDEIIEATKDSTSFSAISNILTFNIESTLTLGEMRDSMEPVIDEYDMYYEDFEGYVQRIIEERQAIYRPLMGEYWCQIQESNNAYQISNIIELQVISTYTGLKPCSEPQSERNTTCADILDTTTKSSIEATMTIKPTAMYTSWTIDSHITSTILVPSSYYLDNSEKRSTTIRSQLPLISNFMADNNMLSTDEPSVLFKNRWEIIIICLGAVVVISVALVVTSIIIIVKICKKEKQQKNQAHLAVSKFDNPTYNKSTEEYIEPVSINVHKITAESDNLSEAEYCQVDEDREAYYYTQPVKIKTVEYSYADPATLCRTMSQSVKDTADSKTNALPVHQYQSLRIDTKNYLSIYNWLENHDCSTKSSTEINLTVDIYSTPPSSTHEEEDHDYINVH